MARTRSTTFLSAAILILFLGEICSANDSKKDASEIIPVEVFHVQQLPVTLASVELVSSEGGYRFRCSMTNYSDEKILGFRYSLVAISADRTTTLIANRSEALVVAQFATKEKTFSTIPLKLKNQIRFVLMLEQIVGRDSIWEVIKAKDALEAYASGDYSTVPVVLRVPNHVDVAPQQQRIRY